MSTLSSSLPAVRKRKLWPRILFWLTVLLVVAVLGLLGLSYSIVRSALPQLDGTLSVAGLSGPVTVIREAHGVPTIEAVNLSDLFFAQGYVTAQDRLWQMDTMRRFAAGELSEILGPDLLRHDREQRILGMRQAAQRALALLLPEDRAYVDAYAKGVNAHIDSHLDGLPLEYRILGYSPRLWSAEDSTLIATQMVKDLNHGTYREALERERILAKLGPEFTADLYVNSSWHDRPPTALRPTLQNAEPDEEDNEEDGPDSGVAQVHTLLSTIPGEFNFDSDDRYVLGSNNWVVSGSHTTSGKPLLS